jgi:hypothetical protein
VVVQIGMEALLERLRALEVAGYLVDTLEVS